MKENQKVYVKATYVGDKLSSINIICSLVMFSFLDDVDYYNRNDNFNCSTHIANFIAKSKNTSITYELFICNFNEIINYLH